MKPKDALKANASALDSDVAFEVEDVEGNIDGDLRAIVLHYITGKRIRIEAMSDFDGIARLVITELN